MACFGTCVGLHALAGVGRGGAVVASEGWFAKQSRVSERLARDSLRVTKIVLVSVQQGCMCVVFAGVMAERP